MPREFKTIVCATDFSEPSYHSIEYALQFAKLSGGTIILAHVIHVPAGDLIGETHTLNFSEALDKGRSMLADVHRTKLAEYSPCEIQVEIGDPATHILKLATDRRADLVITSTHGRSGLSHLVMGSVAEKIVRHAPCPVFVVRYGVD